MNSKIPFKWGRCLWKLNLLLIFSLSPTVSAQNIQSILIENWAGTDWQNQILSTNSYDGSDYLISTLLQSWTMPSGPWENSIQQINTNNPNGTVNQALSQSWDAGTSTWNDVQRQTFTYNAANDVLTQTTEIWLGASWMNSTNTTNTYDASGYLINSVSQNYDFFGGTWQNSTQNIYTNNANGTVDQDVLQTWSGSAWDNTSRFSYTYNASDDVLTALQEAWTGSAWENAEMTVSTYDGSGYLISTVTQAWDDTSAWVNDSRSDYTNNAAGNPVQIVDQAWNVATSSWDNATRITITYTGLGLPGINQEFVTLYPNPSNDFINVKFGSLIGGEYSLIDQQGREVKNGNFQMQDEIFDVSALASGVYFLRFTAYPNNIIRIVKN